MNDEDGSVAGQGGTIRKKCGAGKAERNGAPAEDGCVGESIFISEDSFGERGQRRTSREVIKPPPQQYLRYGMTEVEVQKSLSDDAYCSDYRAVFPNEAAAMIRFLESWE